jgi:hypothetical protein
MRYAREVHAHEVHAHEVHIHEIHACEGVYEDLARQNAREESRIRLLKTFVVYKYSTVLNVISYTV